MPFTQTLPHLCPLKLNTIFHHVQTSQYFLQTVMCENRRWCYRPREIYFPVTPDHFLHHNCRKVDFKSQTYRTTKITSSHLFLLDELYIISHVVKVYKFLPYDFLCPPVQSLLQHCYCKNCFMYFTSIVLVKKHLVVCL